MNKLNHVQAELKKQGLGLKVYDGFRPLYVEAALVKCGHHFTSYPYNDFILLDHYERLKAEEPHIISYDPLQWLKEAFSSTPPLIPFGNRGAMVAVTLVDAHGKELAMPTAFDDRGEQSCPYYQQLPQHILANRELLKGVMLKHGFKQADTWYEFYDDQIDEYPHWLYASYTTALQLDKEQENDRVRMETLINALINPRKFSLEEVQKYSCLR